MVMRIAYLTSHYFNENSPLDRELRFLINLAKAVVETSHGTCTIELTVYGDASLLREIVPGVHLRILSAVRTRADSADMLSWELPELIAAADVIHIHETAQRSTDLCLLLARQQHKPICVSAYGGEQSALGQQVDSLALADRLLCHSGSLATRLTTHCAVEVIAAVEPESDLRTAGAKLLAIYKDLLTEVHGIAA